MVVKLQCNYCPRPAEYHCSECRKYACSWHTSDDAGFGDITYNYVCCTCQRIVKPVGEKDD